MRQWSHACAKGILRYGHEVMGVANEEWHPLLELDGTPTEIWTADAREVATKWAPSTGAFWAMPVEVDQPVHDDIDLVAVQA